MGKQKPSEGEDIVYKFLSKENRPFSVQNIVDALQREGVKKTAVERSLASLVEKGAVAKKEYGKAKIFILAQDKIELPDPEEVARLDEEIKSLSESLAEEAARVSAYEKELGILRNELTVNEAQSKASELATELVAKEEKRAKLGDASNLTSKEDKQKLEQSYFDIRALWKKYKRLITDIVNQIGEGTGKKNAELFEDMGIETDESVNIKISDFPEIQNPSKARRFPGASRVIKRQRQK